jgi:PAS domain S-box-containing protein
MPQPRSFSISRKLTIINMLASGAALLLASSALFFYDFHTFKQDLLRQLSTEAQIVGSNSFSALAFNDPDSARRTLSALQASPHVLYAAIYTDAGSLFAEYRRDRNGNVRLPSANGRSDHARADFENDQFSVAEPIVFQGGHAGNVYLVSDTNELESRIHRYLGIVVAVLLGSLLAAFLVSRASQRRISKPMVKLAETAKLVSREQNYSLRAETIDTQDEVATVIDAFNEMLGQIQQRGAELQMAHDELEKRVIERTAALEDRTLQVAEQARLLNLANDAIFVRTADSKISYWNAGAERLYGWPRQEALGRSPHELLRTEFPVALEDLARFERWEGELRQTTKAGSQIIVGARWTTLRDKNQQFAGWLEICTDITARKRAEEAASRLSGRILGIQDEERRRIARELHDSLGQYLAALKMNIDVLGSDAKTGSPEELPVVLDSCSQLLDLAITETRTISHLLHPPLLDEVGLLSALHWFVEGFSKRSGIHANVDVPSRYERLPQETEIALFRVLQEALTNVHRHSGSTRVDIELRITAPNVWLEVRDYGRGIPEDYLARVREENAQVGVGLAGMRERVRQLGGSLELASTPGGTTIVARIPILKNSTAANATRNPSRGISVAPAIGPRTR